MNHVIDSRGPEEDTVQFAFNMATAHAQVASGSSLFAAFAGLVAHENAELAARCLTALEASLERHAFGGVS
jgi:hypothetical protein